MFWESLAHHWDADYYNVCTLIGLPERHCGTFQHYASSGIVIAAIDDLMNNFNKLIGFRDSQPKVQVLENQSPCGTPSSGKTMACLHNVNFKEVCKDIIHCVTFCVSASNVTTAQGEKFGSGL